MRDDHVGDVMRRVKMGGPESLSPGSWLEFSCPTLRCFFPHPVPRWPSAGPNSAPGSLEGRGPMVQNQTLLATTCVPEPLQTKKGAPSLFPHRSLLTLLSVCLVTVPYYMHSVQIDLIRRPELAAERDTRSGRRRHPSSGRPCARADDAINIGF